MKGAIRIEDMLFSDGIIENYELRSNEFEVLFRDYSNSKLLISFQGDLKVRRQEGVGLFVYEGRVEKAGGRMKLVLLDEDLAEILTVEFASYTIQRAV